MKINSEQIRLLANGLGACSLNGTDARLEPTGNGRLARVVSEKESACFNWSVAQHVVTQKGGRFVTQ